ncbi:hypothetical protein N7462_004554 [Penicillium macrosclerotiorum]|uniref:uncharacterized protein n=1 Tax=Penicillium macrosclerotiorum TaxID=303699 RepID=UPI002547271A|nr:uncharacterized protein N7462_004554 [Penicillium macrosclerotiorum]KAJ5690162.1 hypothetical protein N7462_004554 [Penicillium macrosclerotiorum]
MEAVNKVVHAASTAIWGEQDTNSNQPNEQNVPYGEEPISGVQGKGLANDPYDAGNREEQPDAPFSDANTAPQEPRLDSAKPQVSTKDAVPDIRADTATEANANAGTPIAVGLSAPTAAAAAASGSSNANTESKPEQRSADPTEGEGSQAPQVDDHSKVSEEALKGPQGPAPHPATEFEKEATGKTTSKKDMSPAEKSSSTSSSTGSPPKSNDKLSHSNGSGKHSPLHKMKEKLNKVAHPRHHTNKS